MSKQEIEFLSAVLIVSRQPERLASFYRDVIGVPLREESHGEDLPHWGCDLGDIHFAIHSVTDFPDSRCGVGAVKIAFTVFDIHAVVDEMEKKGVPLLYPPKDTGFFWSTAIEDPDGNFIEFTQMCDAWFKYLEDRRAKGVDVVSRWHAAGDAGARLHGV